MRPMPELTRGRALALQDELVEVLAHPKVQERLRRALEVAGDDPMQRSRVRQAICLPLQEPVVRRFGFADVEQAITAFSAGAFADDPEISERKRTLFRLVDPAPWSREQVEEPAARSLREQAALFNVSMAVGPSRVALPWGSAAPVALHTTGPAERKMSGEDGRRSSRRGRRSQSFDLAVARLRSGSAQTLQRARSVPRPVRGVDPGTPFTRDTAIAFQDALIERLGMPLLQDRLQAAFVAAAGDPVLRSRARQTLCLPMQYPLARRFGFEDVSESIRTFEHEPLRSDPQIIVRKAQIDELVGMPDVPLTARQSNGPDGRRLDKQPGRRWVVVGGAQHGGILVRRGRELTSALLGTRAGPVRLSTDAEVAEIDVYEERLHYRKVSGEGPDFGWVSIATQGEPLLLPRDANDSESGLLALVPRLGE